MIADKQGVEIDYCPQCRGIWLDRGELEKIIERSQNFGFGHNRYDNDHHHDSHHGYDKHDDHHSYKHGYPHNRKKGFLSDLFDF
jgi:Zn-finger nucleic acid-binding protein